MDINNLKNLLSQGENSGLEFKRDEISPEKLAKEMVALANLKGGIILLGVDDDGSITGIQRKDGEEWVMEIARNKISPPLIPYYQEIPIVDEGKKVAVIEIPTSPSKPCRVIHQGRKTAYIRVGSTVREPGDEELAQMHQTSMRLNYGKTPVLGANYSHVDHTRLRSYLNTTLGYIDNELHEDDMKTLVNLEFMIESDHGIVPTVNGMLLFGKTPKKFLPQSGIRAIAYRGSQEDYDAVEDLSFDQAIVPEINSKGDIVEPGLIERIISFVSRHAPAKETLDGARNRFNSIYPQNVLREVMTNAIAHRDYTIAGADIMVNVFADRLEVRSPGRLPNGATVESLKSGFRYYRNQVLVNVLRDLGYVDARGMGIRLKVIPIMKKLAGREPDFRLTDYDFTVVLPSPSI